MKIPIALRGALLVVWLWAIQPRAAVINVGPSDNYTKIEGANPGDEVIIAPGTYAFRVYLTKQASPTNPIYIHAQSPTNPPVWDFGTNLVDNAPGSYHAGDAARGAWQFSGARSYTISGIVFRNCRNAVKNCGAIRYYETTTNLCIRSCLFETNDVGMTGGSEESQAAIEFCEFRGNGNTNAPASAPTHNIYIYGGYLTMRYCFLHDSAQGQDFHIRARQATLEYNWFARAANYEGDLMSDDDFGDGFDSGPFSQAMILRGNVIVQNNAPGNHSQVIAIFNDEGITNMNMSVQALYNTFIGTYSLAQFVHLANDANTTMSALISDNIISGTTIPYSIDDVTNGTASGGNNWLPKNATMGALSNSVQTTAPGFLNPTAEDYHLAAGSACIGTANATVYGLPGREYYYNEITNLMWRPRAAARDIGAFESTSTNAPVGPYDKTPQPLLGATAAQGHVTLSWPLFAQSFQLTQSPAVLPFVWSAAPFGLTTNPANVAATIPISGMGGFFRLEE